MIGFPYKIYIFITLRHSDGSLDRKVHHKSSVKEMHRTEWIL